MGASMASGPQAFGTRDWFCGLSFSSDGQGGSVVTNASPSHEGEGMGTQMKLRSLALCSSPAVQPGS